MNEKWLKQYKDNYYERSAEAKSLKDAIKVNYNNSKYLPWAVMERVTYMQDPEANFEIVRTASFETPSVLHTSKVKLHTLNETSDKKVETDNAMFTHFVVVRLTFLDKKFEEVYPVQDNSYKAPKFIDQNMVNKALQRAKAKIASRATGLGLKLYEGLDLQFVDGDKKAIPKERTTEKIIKDVTDETDASVEVTDMNSGETSNVTDVVNVPSAGVTKLIDFIRNNEGAEKALQKVNTSVANKYGFTISKDDTDVELITKLSEITNAGTFLRTLVKFSE